MRRTRGRCRATCSGSAAARATGRSRRPGRAGPRSTPRPRRRRDPPSASSASAGASQRTARRRRALSARAWRIASSSRRPSAENPCPPERVTDPRWWMSMSVQRANRSVIAAVALGIGVLEHRQRLVGEHDPEAERVGRPVALEHRDRAVRRDLAHQDREVQAAGSPTDHGDPSSDAHTPRSLRCSYSSARLLTTLCIRASAARTFACRDRRQSSAHNALSSS